MLEYLKKRLENREDVSVVYLGGSITEGAGASKTEKRWASLTQTWLEKSYPESTFTCYNAGIGGTNSEWGVFRLERDVLSHHPNLVFVEFAVNDYQTPHQQCLNAMEDIVRRIRSQDRETEIVLVLTAMYKMEEECYSRGERPESVRIHERVAAHYGLPVIHTGEALLKRIREDRVDPAAYLPDLVHPNDQGYQIYFTVVKHALEKMLAGAGEPQGEREAKLPAPLGDLRYQDARVEDAGKLADTDFRKEAISLCGRYTGYISSDIPGTAGRVEFDGTGIGLYWMIGADSGKLCWSIDGGEKHVTSSWDTYALRFDRCNHFMLARELEPGHHVLEFSVADETEERSKGRFIRIAAFLIM